jgi:hypothetical protein
MFDVGQIQVQSLIVHEIPRHYLRAEDAGGGPVLSDVESSLNQTVRNFFQERMAGSLGRAAFEVELDPQAESRAPALITGLLANPPTDFVGTSRELAQILYQCQGGISPQGLLTVMTVTVEGRPGVAIIKLEKEEGTRVQRKKVQGGSTFSVDHLRDLMLTGKTRVFKVGLFARSTESGEIRGLVCDKQKGPDTTVAFFFLQRFLGCRLCESPEITTSHFYEAAQRFINEDVDDPEVKARYQVAIAQELSSTRTSVSPEAFANTNLETGDRAALLSRMEEAGVGPGSFPKDLAIVGPALRRIQWHFQQGVVVLASPEQVGSVVQVERLDDGRTRLAVTDALKDVQGHR